MLRISPFLPFLSVQPEAWTPERPLAGLCGAGFRPGFPEVLSNMGKEQSVAPRVRWSPSRKDWHLSFGTIISLTEDWGWGAGVARGGFLAASGAVTRLGAGEVLGAQTGWCAPTTISSPRATSPACPHHHLSGVPHFPPWSPCFPLLFHLTSHIIALSPFPPPPSSLPSASTFSEPPILVPQLSLSHVCASLHLLALPPVVCVSVPVPGNPCSPHLLLSFFLSLSDVIFQTLKIIPCHSQGGAWWIKCLNQTQTAWWGEEW